MGDRHCPSACKIGVCRPSVVCVSNLFYLTYFVAVVSASFRSRAALQLEILALRHQLGVLQRSVKRPKLSPADRLLWAWLSSVWNGWESRVSIVRAATVIGWQRKGFGLFWRWK